MRFSTRALLSALPLFSFAATTSAQLLDLDLDVLGLTDLNLDVDLLQGGSLVTVGAFGDLLSAGQCPGGNIGVRAGLLNLVRLCVCLSVLEQGPNDTLCPSCPENAQPVCGDAKCACQCNEGFFASSDGLGCLPIDACTSSGGTLESQGDGTFSCSCASPFVTSNGICVLPPSQAAARRRRNVVLAANPLSAPFTSAGVTLPSSHYCPDEETACPLTSGGYECVDTTSSLLSCGGCVGAGLAGQNCLTIPGALGVSCVDSKCEVSSCFRGFTWHEGRCI